MTLSANHLQALKTELLNDPTGLGYAQHIARSIGALVLLLNAATTFIVWRTRVTQDEIMGNGFDWVRVDNLSVGKARIWEWLFANRERVFNPSKANVRAGVAECWKGTAADVAVRDAVLEHCKRAANRAEQIVASGTGSSVSPGLLTFEGTVTVDDVVDALRLP